jgi:hypothetical protein
METPLLVFVPELTSRISYTFSLFFESLLSTAYKLTRDIEEYKAYKGPKLNYSGKVSGEDGLFFKAAGLLSEKGISKQNISVADWQGLKVFYRVDGGALPFDVFSASFYMVSRYEEYLSESYDEHKRFKVTYSLAFKNHFLDIPIVNAWAEELKKILIDKYPSLIIAERKYTFTPTIDIDVAYAHLGRSKGVTMGAYMKLFSRFDIKAAARKMSVLSGKTKDEYDTYDYQEEIFRKYNVKPIYFILAADRSAYDKNIETESDVFKLLVKRLSAFAGVGIHPSYRSESVKERVEVELKRVENILGNRITKSRQHYLRITLPDTYRCLAKLGITDDYSMAFAASPGFRAGMCSPFNFYDLQAEEVLPVKIHPTIVMDGTFNEYLGVTPEIAIETTQKLVLQVKKYKGEFISIWHNHSLNEQQHWKGWRRVFEETIKAGV